MPTKMVPSRLLMGMMRCSDLTNFRVLISPAFERNSRVLQAARIYAQLSRDSYMALGGENLRFTDADSRTDLK
jgi:hypothetical protein